MIVTETIIKVVEVRVDLVRANKEGDITTVPVTVAHQNLGGEGQRLGILLHYPRMITIRKLLLKLISTTS